MKKLLLAVGLVLVAAGTASARIEHGLPIFLFPAPEASTSPAPPTYGAAPQTPSGGFYWAPPQVTRDPDGSRTVVEEIYKDGRLVERRVKCYPKDWAGYR